MEYHATLPTPPSVNNLFRTVQRKDGTMRRVVVREYAAWREEAGRLVAWPRLTEDARNQIPWTIRIAAFNLSRRRDVDNLVKPIVDLIVEQTGLRDSWLEEVTACRSSVEREGPCVSIHIVVLGRLD
jgi:Holliday junction resolvase RusA-like endonuclease